jgi:ribonuclease Z
MQLTFLGTSAGRPTKARNVTSIALTLTSQHNRYWLFDVGEGTQHRLLGTPNKLNKLERIFITHMHGDHLYGLPGLLSSRSYYDGASDLKLFGPPGLRTYIECVLHQSGARLDYELETVEIGAGRIYEDDHYTVEAAELDHRITCFGYRITEKPQPGKLDLALLERLGVTPGPLYGKLKKGEDIALANGEIVRSTDAVGPVTHGRIVTILGDTRPCDNANALAMNADVLVHEATFATGMEEKAKAYGHSTALQAAHTAARAGAKRLILTHFSSRFDDEAVAQLVDDVKPVFANIEAAHDYLAVCIPKPV